MILTVVDPIHTQDVIVAIDEPNEWAIIRAVTRTGYRIQDPEEMAEILEFGNATAKTVMDSASGAVVMRFKRLRPPDPVDVSDLVHEAVHAATMLFERVGFPLEARTDEPMAYYVAFLVRSVLEGVCRRKGAASAVRTKRTARMCGTARCAGTTSATPAARSSSNGASRR